MNWSNLVLQSEIIEKKDRFLGVIINLNFSQVRHDCSIKQLVKYRIIDVGTVYISSKCRIARADLRQIVIWGGGEVVNTARVAAVVVGEFCHVGDSSTPQFVTDNWILDSVQNNVIMPFLDYPL